MLRNIAGQKWRVYAWDATTGLPKTGDAANITGRIRIDDGSSAATDDVNPTEASSTNEKGYYDFDLTQAETNGDKLSLVPESSTSNVVVVACPPVIYTRPQYSSILGITSGGKVPSTIAAGDIANNAITAASIASDAIQAAKIQDGAFTAAKFASGAFDAVWSVSARTLTAATNITAGIAQAVWEYATRTLTAFSFTPSLHSDYDAAKTAAQAGDKMDLVDAPNATAVEAIAVAIEQAILDDDDGQAILEAIVGAIGNQNVDEIALVAAIRADLERSGGDLNTLLARLTSSRAGYIDKLNVSGTLAHSDAAETYKADVSGLATETNATANKEEILSAIDGIEGGECVSSLVGIVPGAVALSVTSTHTLDRCIPIREVSVGGEIVLEARNAAGEIVLYDDMDESARDAAALAVDESEVPQLWVAIINNLDPPLPSGAWRGLFWAVGADITLSPQAVSDATVIGESLDMEGIAAQLDDIDGIDHKTAMKRILAVLCGKVSGAGTGTETFRDIADTANRVVVTVDSSGNRTNVTFA